MSAPDVNLGGAVFTALKAHAPLTALVGTRIYDAGNVPKSAVFPYLTVQPAQCSEDDDACGQHWLASVQVDVWSRKSGNTLEARSILGPVRAALDSITSVAGFGLNYGQYRLHRTALEQDHLTAHGLVQYEFHLSAL